jgi:hypothetical protein
MAQFNHIKLAHHYWKTHLKPGDIAIDATCGNGQDSLYIAKHVLTENSGALYLFDIQQIALDQTRLRLSSELNAMQISRVHFCHLNHSEFCQTIKPETVSLIAYNLGYLPGGEKSITTLTETTLMSLNNALSLIKPGGLISVTCYPGHAEGLKEEEAILNWSSQCNPSLWSCCLHKWINKPKSPSLLIIQKNSI